MAETHYNEHVPQSMFTDHLWQEICKRSNRFTRSDVDMFVKEFTRNLAGALRAGYRLEFLNFGVFRVVSTNAVRRGIPGRPGESRINPPRCKVAFVASKPLKRGVLKLPASSFPRGKTRAERPVKARRDPT
jgi:nucleoid DNA-binding protein